VHLELRRGSAIEHATLPARVEVEVLEPDMVRDSAAPADRVAEAMRRPLGEGAGISIPAHASVLVLVPDATRPAFLPEILPVVLAELERQGVARRRVQIAIAGGAHATPSDARARALVGEEAARGVVHRHDASSGPHFRAGETHRGTPVELDDALREAEAVVAIGPVAWHYFAGYGGGPKLVFPGMASRRGAESNHALSLAPTPDESPLHPGCRPGVLHGNPVAEDLREAAGHAPVDYEVSFVADDAGIAAAWAGRPPRAQQAAQEWLSEHARRGAPQAGDLVVTSAGGFPHDVDWIQAHKALFHAGLHARPGATLVLVAECGEGIGSPSFERAMSLPEEESRARLREHFMLNGQTALSTRWHARRHRVILVSRLAAEMVRTWGFEPATDLGAALVSAAPPAGARVVLLPRATAVVPLEEEAPAPA
jgi:nickel-dependent lactate racemase